MLEALQAEYGTSRRITIRIGNAASQIDWVLSKNPTRAKHRGGRFP